VAKPFLELVVVLVNDLDQSVLDAERVTEIHPGVMAPDLGYPTIEIFTVE
jgi:hypothetical protein